jgi:hypothetical protein
VLDGIAAAWIGVVGVGVGAAISMVQQRLLLTAKRKSDQQLMWQEQRRLAYTQFMIFADECYRAVDVKHEGDPVVPLTEAADRDVALEKSDALLRQRFVIEMLTEDEKLLVAVDSIASALKTMFRIALGKEVDEARSAEPATIDDAFVRADNRRRQALAEFQRAAGSSAHPYLILVRRRTFGQAGYGSHAVLAG